jgi:pimeloyl-ACP methyl ester carboxylesterase/DNA-binding CsgD family transcriptional regulator
MKSAGKKGQGAGPDSLVDGVYAAALDPARFPALVEAWESQSRDGTVSDYSKLDTLGVHLDAATRMVGMLEPNRTGLTASSGPEMFAAYVLLPDGRIGAPNDVAVAQFGDLVRGSLDGLPFSADGLSTLRMEAKRLALSGVGTHVLLRITGASSQRQTIVRLTACEGPSPRAVHVRHSQPHWPTSLDDDLQSLYGVTTAEADVAKLIAEGFSVADIALARGRRVLTIRTQVRALLRKLEATNHADLARIVYALAAMSVVSAPSQAARVNYWRHLKLRDGRVLGYMILGDPKGRPFLWLPSAMGIYRLTTAMESDLARKQLCMIVPARAGYGPSSAAPPGVPAFETAARDVQALLVHLGTGALPVVCVGQDLCAAVHLVKAHPDCVTSVIACAPVLPAFERRHFARMNTLQRFFAANARHAPRALNFVVRAGFAMARRLGTRRFALAAFGNCAADAALLDDPEVFSTLMLGSQPVLSEMASAHVAFAAETRELNMDWSDILFAVKQPLTFFAGTEDAEAPIATIREFAPHLETLTVIALENQGRLAMFTRWSTLLDVINDAVGGAQA